MTSINKKLLQIFICFFVICCLQSVVIATSQTIHINNELVLFDFEKELTHNESLEHIFLIKRLERTNEPIILEYNITLFKEHKHIFHSTYFKEITHYSRTHTGTLPPLSEGIYELHVTIQNKKIIWNFLINKSTFNMFFEAETNLTHIENLTTEIANNTNQSELQISDSILTNTTHSELNESTIQNETNTTMQEQLPEHKITETNTTDTEHVDNSSDTFIEENEIETNNQSIEQTTCPLRNFSITTNKQKYIEGEQVHMYFSIEPKPINFTITYWIEDLYGEIIKEKLHTKNTNTKTFTLKQNNQPEKIFLFKGIYEDSCSSFELEHVFFVLDENNSIHETQVNSNKEETSNVDIQRIETKNTKEASYIEIQMQIYKGNTAKSVFEIFASTVNGKRISPIQKIKILQKYQSVEYTIQIPITAFSKFEEEILVTFQGIDMFFTESVLVKKPASLDELNVILEENYLIQMDEPDFSILNTYTRHSYLDDGIDWYVRLSGTGLVDVIIQTKNKNTSTQIQLSGEETIKIHLDELETEEHIETLLFFENKLITNAISTIHLKRKNPIETTDEKKPFDIQSTTMQNFEKELIQNTLRAKNTSTETPSLITGNTVAVTSSQIDKKNKVLISISCFILVILSMYLLFTKLKLKGQIQRIAKNINNRIRKHMN